jgi:hypothetical protein
MLDIGFAERLRDHRLSVHERTDYLGGSDIGEFETELCSGGGDRLLVEQRPLGSAARRPAEPFQAKRLRSPEELTDR